MLKGVLSSYIGLLGITRLQGLRGVTRGYKGLQRVTKGFKW